MSDAQAVKACKEVEGEREKLAAEIDGAVHVERDMLETAQAFDLGLAERLVVILRHRGII